MKSKLILFVFTLSMLVGHGVYSQKLVKKMARNVCDCIEEIKEDYLGEDPGVILQKCFGPVVAKYESQIKKNYGANVFDVDNNNQLYELGMEVGKIMASNCPVYLELFIDQLSSAKEYFELAEGLYEQKNFTEAIKNYDEAIRIESENHEYFNSRGIAYFAQEDYYNAISDFIEAIKINPDFALGYYNLAYSKYELGDYEKALRDAKTAHSMDPSYCNANNLIGLIYNSMDNMDSAYLSFKAAYLCDSTVGLYAFNTAYLLYSSGEYKDAIRYFNKALILGYEDIQIYSHLGNCYNNLQQYEDALLTHSTYIEMNENDYVGYYNRGIAYKNMTQYTSAIEDFKNAAVRDSTDSDIWYNLAQCHLELGYVQEANKLFDKAIGMNSGNAAYYDSRAAFFASIGDYEHAIEDSNISLRLYPDDCNVHMDLSRWYMELSQKEKSEEAYKKALELGCEE